MIFTVIIGLLFLAIVFFHYLQGFFSSAISAVLAVLAAVLAFSWHETLVERLLQGKAANVAHSMVLVALFAAIYLILRTIFDKAVPDGISLPAAIDRVGGAIMGIVAASFALGILAIAAQELPLGASVAGYTKYDTKDSAIQLPGSGGQLQTGFNYDELHSSDAGRYDENDRKQLFPILPAGVDEIVVKTVEHLSSIGSMQGSQPLDAVHPDFLQELYGQRAGIQGGAQHVTLNLPSQPQPAVAIQGVYSVSKVRLVDGEYSMVRQGAVTLPLKLDKPFDMVIGKNGSAELTEKVQYATVANDKENGREMILIVVRITFGVEAADSEDRTVRLSPGAIRLVANRPDKAGEPHDYYPIGTLEAGTPNPMLYVDKPDDFIFVPADSTGSTRSGIDAVFAVDKAGILDEAPGKKPRIADNAFIEVKRLFREDLSGKTVEPWTRGPGMTIGSLHQIKLHPAVTFASTQSSK